MLLILPCLVWVGVYTHFPITCITFSSSLTWDEHIKQRMNQKKPWHQPKLKPPQHHFLHCNTKSQNFRKNSCFHFSITIHKTKKIYKTIDQKPCFSTLHETKNQNFMNCFSPWHEVLSICQTRRKQQNWTPSH